MSKFFLDHVNCFLNSVLHGLGQTLFHFFRVENLLYVKIDVDFPSLWFSLSSIQVDGGLAALTIFSRRISIVVLSLTQFALLNCWQHFRIGNVFWSLLWFPILHHWVFKAEMVIGISSFFGWHNRRYIWLLLRLYAPVSFHRIRENGSIVKSLFFLWILKNIIISDLIKCYIGSVGTIANKSLIWRVWLHQMVLALSEWVSTSWRCYTASDKHLYILGWDSWW